MLETLVTGGYSVPDLIGFRLSAESTKSRKKVMWTAVIKAPRGFQVSF